MSVSESLLEPLDILGEIQSYLIDPTRFIPAFNAFTLYSGFYKTIYIDYNWQLSLGDADEFSHMTSDFKNEIFTKFQETVEIEDQFYLYYKGVFLYMKDDSGEPEQIWFYSNDWNYTGSKPFEETLAYLLGI